MKFYLVETYSSLAVNSQPCCVALINRAEDRTETDEYISRLGYSETVFFLGCENDMFITEYYSDGRRVPFNIHSAIALSTILAEEGLLENRNEYLENTGSALLSVTRADDFIRVKALPAANDSNSSYNSREAFYSEVGIRPERVAKRPAGEILGNSLPYIITMTLPDISTPVVDVRTLFTLFSHLNLRGEMKALEEQLGFSSGDMITDMETSGMFRAEALPDESDSDEISAAIHIGSPSQQNFASRFDLQNSSDRSSYGRISCTDDGAVTFCGTGKVMAEGQMFF